MNSFIPWTGVRRTAAGEMLPYALRASGNQCFASQFYAVFLEDVPTFAPKVHWEAIAGTGSVPAD